MSQYCKRHLFNAPQLLQLLQLLPGLDEAALALGLMHPRQEERGIITHQGPSSSAGLLCNTSSYLFLPWYRS